MVAIRGSIVTAHPIIIRAVPCTAAIMPHTPSCSQPVHHSHHEPRGRPIAGPHSESIIEMAHLPSFSFAWFRFSQYTQILKASGWAGIFRPRQVGLSPV